MKQKLLPAIYLVFLTITCLSLFACNKRSEDIPSKPSVASDAGSNATPPASVAPPVAGSTFPNDAAADTTAGNETMSASNKPLSNADKAFFSAAAQSGYAEISASQLARERSSSSLIKDFADMMIIQHNGVGKDLKSLAVKKGIQLPESDPGKYKADLDALAKLNGVAFDRAYAERVGVAAHTEAVALFEKTANEGSDPDVKTFASTNLPTLKRHLEMAQNLPKV